MKVFAFVFLSFFLGKSCSHCTKNDIEKAVINYQSNSRGFFQNITISNQIVSISHDRKGVEIPKEIKISDADWDELIELLKNVDLEQIPNLKDPTQQRFYDGAAMAEFKVTFKDKVYQTTTFDHGFPPAEIEKIVNKVVSLGEQRE